MLFFTFSILWNKFFIWTSMIQNPLLKSNVVKPQMPGGLFCFIENRQTIGLPERKLLLFSYRFCCFWFFQGLDSLDYKYDRKNDQQNTKYGLGIRSPVSTACSNH